jgi:hypothetical protein
MDFLKGIKILVKLLIYFGKYPEDLKGLFSIVTFFGFSFGLMIFSMFITFIFFDIFGAIWVALGFEFTEDTWIVTSMIVFIAIGIFLLIRNTNQKPYQR